MPSFEQIVYRARARFVFPTLAVAMGLSTLVAGLERSSFLGKVAGVEQVARPETKDVVEGLASDLGAVVIGTRAGSSRSLDAGIQHAQIDQWVQRLTTSSRGQFMRTLDRKDQYEPMILAKLDARQMPRELIYLAMIESEFNPTARSRVGAVGMWQFMSATGRQFGLTVTRRVDERKNPAEATDAALTYLTQLHDRFGSWYLAAAAYNSGPGTVSKAMRKELGRTKGTDADFFRIAARLPKETRDYVPKLIATARVGSDPARYGM